MISFEVHSAARVIIWQPGVHFACTILHFINPLSAWVFHTKDWGCGIYQPLKAWQIFCQGCPFWWVHLESSTVHLTCQSFRVSGTLGILLFLFLSPSKWWLFQKIQSTCFKCPFSSIKTKLQSTYCAVGIAWENSMIGENRQFITNEPVEFEKWPVEAQDCRKITDHFRGIYRIYPNLIKENWRISTCNRLDLQTLRSEPEYARKSPRSLGELG